MIDDGKTVKHGLTLKMRLSERFRLIRKAIEKLIRKDEINHSEVCVHDKFVTQFSK